MKTIVKILSRWAELCRRAGKRGQKIARQPVISVEKTFFLERHLAAAKA